MILLITPDLTARKWIVVKDSDLRAVLRRAYGRSHSSRPSTHNHNVVMTRVNVHEVSTSIPSRHNI
jgi:hypothetical protein